MPLGDNLGTGWIGMCVVQPEQCRIDAERDAEVSRWLRGGLSGL
jgi:hypothetical protein